MLDEFRSTNITWDKATSRIYSPVTANASDENGRKLVVQIVNGGQVEDLTGATLHLYWETRDKAHDGLDVFDAVDLKKGEFELSYTTGMLSNQGVLNANLVLIDTVGRVVSDRFKITVTEGIDDDAIQSENSFSSLTQALIDISNLEQNYVPRLNDLTAQLQQTEQELSSQLADKIDKGDVSVYDIDKNKGKLDQTFMTEEFIQQMAGTTPVNAIPARSSVGLQQLNWINVVNLNLHNRQTDIQDFTVSWSTGGANPTVGYRISDFIPIEASKQYYNSNALTCAFYDVNKVYISGLNANHTRPYTTPANATFVKHSYFDNEDGVLCEGNTIIKPTATFGEQLVDLNSSDFERIISEAANKNINVPDGSMSVEKMAYLKTTILNLHNPATDTQGFLILNGNGSTQANAGYKASDFIPIQGGKQYSNSNALNAAFYDVNKVYISGLSAGHNMPYTAPANARFVRHTYGISEYGVLCEGAALIKANAVFGEKEVKFSDTELIKEIKRVSAEPNTKGKTALLFGDSITQTHNWAEDGTTSTFSRTNWATHAISMLELGTVKNYAKDGASYKDSNGTFYQSLSNQINTAISTNATTDIVVIAAGTNDGIGSIGDYSTAMGKTTLSSLDRSLLYEAIRWAFWRLREAYPNAAFYVGVPTQRADKTVEYVEPMTTAIKKMAKAYGFIVMDAEAESGIVKEFEVWQAAGRYLSDGLHPNDDGKLKLGKFYSRVIRNTFV